MLPQKQAQATLETRAPLWTQDESIAFECAKEVIGNMIAICSALLWKEKKAACPNSTRIKELEQKRSAFELERKNLHLDEKEKISRVRKHYGDQIKRYYKGGECPV